MTTEETRGARVLRYVMFLYLFLYLLNCENLGT